ncbi:MAG: hypothetical protein M5U34_20315 [Chloroflexi bacterium]|nr:hypothetical protein [Chloroflexota bacterium]
MMRGFLRQLRWRIVIANMIVVVVGVVLLLLAAFLLINQVAPAEATAAVLASFRRSILTAVSLAAGGAIIAGLATSFLIGAGNLAAVRRDCPQQ